MVITTIKPIWNFLKDRQLVLVYLIGGEGDYVPLLKSPLFTPSHHPEMFLPLTKST